jgi:hypothetical protein
MVAIKWEYEEQGQISRYWLYAKLRAMGNQEAFDCAFHTAIFGCFGWLLVLRARVHICVKSAARLVLSDPGPFCAHSPAEGEAPLVPSLSPFPVTTRPPAP